MLFVLAFPDKEDKFIIHYFGNDFIFYNEMGLKFPKVTMLPFKVKILESKFGNCLHYQNGVLIPN